MNPDIPGNRSLQSGFQGIIERVSANPDATAAIDAVGHTALGVARARAAESARPDALFDDPYAAEFDPGGFAGTADRRPRDPAAVLRMYNWIVARTVFLDELVTDAAVDQIVVLGAGLDTRALRLPLPATTVVYELDRNQLFDYKEPILAASSVRGRSAATRRTVVADLTEDWQKSLCDSGFAPARPSLWLAEGLLVYLAAAEAEAVLDGIDRLSAPGSAAAFTARNRSGVGSLAGDDTYADVRRLWRSAIDVPEILERRGWTVEVTDPGDVLREHGRGDAAVQLDPVMPPQLVVARR